MADTVPREVLEAQHQITLWTEEPYAVPLGELRGEMERITFYQQGEGQADYARNLTSALRVEVKKRLEAGLVLDPVMVYEVYERNITGSDHKVDHISRSALQTILRHAATQPHSFMRLQANEGQRQHLRRVLGAIGALWVENGVTISMMTDANSRKEPRFALFMAVRPVAAELVETAAD